jgi:hypothetical protein
MIPVDGRVSAALGKQFPGSTSFMKLKSLQPQMHCDFLLMGKKHIDLFILDGEAVPEGGMGVAQTIKDEVFNCPPVLLITAQNIKIIGLATWSRAEATVTAPN